MVRNIIIGVCITLLIGCGKDDAISTSSDAHIQAWLDSLSISASRDDDTGIYYYADTSNPSGTQASSGSVAAIFYTLSDLNGNVIASRASGDSLIFKIGASAVYPIGVDVAVSLMRVGEVYNFILPPEQAYQDLTSGAINPGLIAHIRIELVGVFNEDDLFSQEIIDIDDYISDNNLNDIVANPLDEVEQFSASGISYKRLAAGTGDLPQNGDSIEVNYTGRFISNSTFASDNGFQWIYGSGQPRELLTGFEFGVSLMQTGERALIMIPSSQGYRESALVIPAFIANDLVQDSIIPDYVTTVPPYQTLLFEINRVD